MKDVHERIEGSFRLIAFRRLKRRIFLAEVIMLVAMAFVLMAIMGASLKPFYIPLDYFALMMFVLVLLLVPETQYLRLLEIAQTKSKSGKYLMARNNVRTATLIIVLCVAFVAMFLMPPSVEAMENGYTETARKEIPVGGSELYNFTTRDSMGTRTATSVTFQPSSGNASIYILRAEFWDEGFSETDVENWVTFVDEGGTLAFYPGEYARVHQEYAEYIVSMNSSSPTPVFVDVTLRYEISDVVTGYMPFLGIIFIVIEGLTVSYFLPIREKYASSSIFSKDYVEKKDAGSEKLSEREAALERALSDDEIAKEAALSEAACETDLPKPKATAPTKAEQARKKGVVDIAAASSKDVACPTCGAMNSQDSALCFSCGNAIESLPASQASPEDLMGKGKEFLDLGRTQDAIWCFDEVLKMDHKNEAALFLKASALASEGRRELAIQYLNTVIQNNPSNQDAYLTRAASFEGLEMLDKAADSYEKALAIGPSELAKTKLAEFRERDREEVINQFMTLPGIGPAKAQALYDSGITSVESLRGASLEKMCSVRGINERLARKVLKEMGREV
jgi:tetratricopeptide (TPR) repeat protein